MAEGEITRRSLVAGGFASVVATRFAFDSTSSAGAAGVDGDILVGWFARADGARSAVVAVPRRGQTAVTLDPDAFVTHGTEGVVDSLERFVPGEEVVVRGVTSGREVAAFEFQSVYTSATGTIVEGEDSLFLVAVSGQRVHVPVEVVQRRAPSGIRTGVTYFATIWTDPRTGEATALDLDEV